MEKEISTINRAYISILPKQPFYDWANSIFKDSTPLTAADMEAMAFAIHDDFAVKDLSTVVKRHAPFIFEMELFGVCTDPDQWPQDRSWQRFTEWFSYHVGSMVWDLVPELPLAHDEEP
ncbi:MAG: hypothetical protein IPJ76_02370 [Flavobacteriales bacterium]|nr:MAG: hypothetical protein IPJ76_02370 [Flavobacteriales bacterium]